MKKGDKEATAVLVGLWLLGVHYYGWVLASAAVCLWLGRHAVSHWFDETDENAGQ